jgi:polyisoprenoid-binding protein YceI
LSQTAWRLFVLALSLAPAVVGQRLTVSFDPAATKINWILAGNVHTTHGTFQLKEGHVSFNPANGSISGELVIEADSGESGNGARDKRMKKEVLETDKYPEVRLKVAKLEGPVTTTGSSNVQMLGQLMIHGTSHEVSIPLQITLAGAEFTCNGKFAIPFVAWGMKDPSNFLFKVDKTVGIELAANGHIGR